eukprot:scaffold154482_cov22-Tisochrysis_lutea.AAC.3
MAISHASLLQVFELEQPVEDQYGYIYEHQAIRATLANHAQRGQPCSCPIAGTVAAGPISPCGDSGLGAMIKCVHSLDLGCQRARDWL